VLRASPIHIGEGSLASEQIIQLVISVEIAGEDANMGADGGVPGGLPRHMTHDLAELDKHYTIPRRPEGARGARCPSKPAQVLGEFSVFRGIPV